MRASCCSERRRSAMPLDAAIEATFVRPPAIHASPPVFHPLHHRRLTCLATLVAMWLCTGCGAFPGRSPGPIHFSPDSSVAASVWDDYRCDPLNFERSLWQTSEVLWCRTNQPESVRSVRILSVGPDYGGYQLGGMIHLSFSPDSRHLAVVAPDALRVIDLADGRCWTATPPGEVVSSLAWFGSEEIGYAAHTALRWPSQDTTDRTFWRQRINASADSRTLVHREVRVKSDLCSRIPSFRWPLEHWSPGGRYVFYQPSRFSQAHVLDSRAGRARAVGA